MLGSLLIVLFALSCASFLAFSKRCRTSQDWMATVTPLASIMGSGFLVSMPLLAGSVGMLAPCFMAGLLGLAYLVGGAIRFNIQHFEPIENDRGLPQEVAFLSRIVLAGAYFISVAYYLQLLAAFLLETTGSSHPQLANWLTTALLCVIGVVGVWRGLKTLESVERFAVALNLGVIAALLVSLACYNGMLVVRGEWALPKAGGVIDWTDLRVVLGLLIVVQGFETSRFLGGEHPAEQRIRTMKVAQWISSAIYLVFICLALVLYREGLGSDVTAIITMTQPVAVVLPLMIAVAAIGSQFSAAVADTAGAGGLIVDITRKRLSLSMAYSLVLLVTVLLTWETNVNEIISYASRAFALFYFLQCVVALLLARRLAVGNRFVFGFAAVACLAVFLLGIPSE